jgi:long-chain acyl-CoA synthetase
VAELLTPLSERLGEAPALVDERGTTHWVDFNLRVNRLIAALRGAGLRPEDTIAILSENRREYFECMTAATHCGLRYVPVNWHWVAEEVAYVLENSDARALICGERFRPLAAEVVARDDCPPLAAAVAMGEEPLTGFLDYEQWLASASEAEPLASAMGGPMFYTSGTTGQPKGVVSSSFSGSEKPVALMKLIGGAITGALSIPADGRTLLVGPTYHSAQWAFAFLPLMTGSAVVMRHGFNAEETLRTIDEHAITNTHLVPTQFVRMLRLDADTRAAFRGDSLASVWHGAAPCSPDVKRAMIDW